MLKNSSLLYFSEYDKDTLSKILSQVSCLHIQVLSYSVKKENNFSIFGLKKESNLSLPIIRSSVEYLVSLVLISKESEVSDASGKMNPQGGLPREDLVDVDVELEITYKVEDLGKQLMEFIEN
mgnify:FL=1